MSRKNKIIESVVGITIVLLALLGITYAYYLTRIQGNTNTNSISITTANLLLKYDDGSGAIVEENIMPGVTFTKTFSVTNEGNAKIDNYVVYLEEVVNDLTRTEDLTYTLICTASSGECAGSSGEYPKLTGIIATNSIEVGVTHNYTLTITYENLPNTDQSIDMGSRINGYIQIYNLQDIVDLTGTVTNASDGDYVQINSVQKISQIVDGKYTLGAVEPGSHTITVRYLDENDEEQIRSTKTITIQKGETASVSGNVITVTNKSQTVNINIDATNSDNYIIEENIIPFASGTLAYKILDNAKNDRNGTSLATDGNYGFVTVENVCVVEKVKIHYTDLEYEEYSDYEKNGGVVNSCEHVIGMRMIDTTNQHTSEADNTTFLINECDGEYAVVKACNFVYITDNVLDTTEDDYGTTYYFRGGPENNYVNFANKCWRIVRIEGDGSVRLVLADKDGECNDSLNTEAKINSGIIGTGEYGYGSGCLNETFSAGKCTDYSNPSNSTTALKYQLDEWYNSNLITYSSKIKLTKNSINDPYEIPSLKTTSEGYKSNAYKIFPLTPDEISYAGLINTYTTQTNTTPVIWIYKNAIDAWWLHSYTNRLDGSLVVTTGGQYDSNIGTTIHTESIDSLNSSGIRPAISLINGTLATGEGTLENPYIIK